MDRSGVTRVKIEPPEERSSLEEKAAKVRASFALDWLFYGLCQSKNKNCYLSWWLSHGFGVLIGAQAGVLGMRRWVAQQRPLPPPPPSKKCFGNLNILGARQQQPTFCFFGKIIVFYRSGQGHILYVVSFWCFKIQTFNRGLKIGVRAREWVRVRRFKPRAHTQCHHSNVVSRAFTSTVEPRFNEPLLNEVLGIMNDILQPGPSYSELYGNRTSI